MTPVDIILSLTAASPASSSYKISNQVQQLQQKQRKSPNSSMMMRRETWTLPILIWYLI